MNAVFQTRPATNDDWELLLKWRNDPLTREHSFSHEVIDEAVHRSWLAGKLQDPDCILVIVSKDDFPVGVLRLDCTENIAEISYTVAPEARGKGCGTAIVGLAEKIAPDRITTLEASVLSDNPASIRCFERNDYRQTLQNGNSYFQKVI